MSLPLRIAAFFALSAASSAVFALPYLGIHFDHRTQPLRVPPFFPPPPPPPPPYRRSISDHGRSDATSEAFKRMCPNTLFFFKYFFFLKTPKKKKKKKKFLKAESISLPGAFQ